MKDAGDFKGEFLRRLPAIKSIQKMLGRMGGGGEGGSREGDLFGTEEDGG